MNEKSDWVDIVVNVLLSPKLTVQTVYLYNQRGVL